MDTKADNKASLRVFVYLGIFLLFIWLKDLTKNHDLNTFIFILIMITLIIACCDIWSYLKVSGLKQEINSLKNQCDKCEYKAMCEINNIKMPEIHN